MNGDQKTGITIFKINEKMDAGPIIAKEAITIDQNMNKKTKKYATELQIKTNCEHD